jgi:hypothetical protein
MHTEKELKTILTSLRTFLEKKWSDKHEEIKSKSLKEYNPVTLDFNMCRYTALFLRSALKTLTEQTWEIKGGDVWEPKFMSGGIKDQNNEWKGHYWLESRGIIIDLTSSQFGHKDIVITDSDNDLYESNYSKSEISSHMKDVKDSVNQWLKEAKKEMLFLKSNDLTY